MQLNRPMNTLTIFYDPRCGLCMAFRLWLDRQKKSVRIEFIDYASDQAYARFPAIRDLHADQDIIVMADDGRWWQGSAAWLVCLWTTYEYRAWSFRFAAPHWEPLVKRMVHAMSTRRHKISQLMGLKSEAQLWQAVTQIEKENCSTGTCQINPATPPALPALLKAKGPTHPVF